MPTTSSQSITLAEQVHTGFLVALWFDQTVAGQLVVDGGEPADNLHVTLCYCPDAAEWDELTSARAIAAVERAVSWRSVLDGVVGGYGRFLACDTSDGQDVFYASVDVPGLTELRSEIESALLMASCAPSDAHGYTPHITLAYLDPGAPNPTETLPALKLRFVAVTIVRGDRRIDIPLQPQMVFAELASLHPTHGVGKDGCRFRDFRRPLTFTSASEWVQFLPPPGQYHHVLYGDMNLSADKYSRIVANFHDHTYGQTLPINAEHDMAASGAVGYIVDMRLGADGSIEVKPEWNDRGQKLIEGDRFRYVSAEFFESWQDPVTGDWHDDVAFGMAICTNPHFKETVLRPLAATEVRPTILSAPAASRTGVAEMTNPAPENRTVTLTETEITQLRETAGRVETAEQTVKALTERAEAAEGQAQTLAERVTAMERDARHKRFTDLVAGRGGAGDGAAWFGDAAKHVAILGTLADIGGEDGPEVQQYTEQQQAIAAQLKGSALFTEIGSSASGATDTQTQIDAAVAKLRETDPKLTREQAEVKVYAENPALFAEAQKEGN